MKPFPTLILVLSMAGGPAMAQSPEAQTVPASGPAALPVQIHPLDRLQPMVARQLALLQSLGEIQVLLATLRQVGPDLLVLLDETMEPREALRVALSSTPAIEPVAAPAAIAELRGEIAALKLLIENSGLLSAPAPYEPALPAPPAEPGETEGVDWQLARRHVRYIQLPDLGSPGRVALHTERDHAELGLRETIDIDGKTITLSGIDELADGGVLLTFLADGEPATIEY